MTARPTGLGSHDLLAMPTPGRGLRYLVADVVAALKADAAPPALPVRRRRDAPSRADLDR